MVRAITATLSAVRQCERAFVSLSLSLFLGGRGWWWCGNDLLSMWL